MSLRQTVALTKPMKNHSESSGRLSISYRSARVGLALLALLACAAPLTHYRVIHYQLDGLRYPWNLLPAELLFFRHFGELSAWFPVGFLAALTGSFVRPAFTLRLFIVGSVAFLCFTVIYLCYSLFIAFVLIHRSA